MAYSILGRTNLFIFNPQAPGSRIIKPITGLQSGETVLSVDMRPATGQLYALGNGF